MKFRTRTTDDPEINLIPFIDVLLVILIFLMLTTTYTRFTQIELTLPTANSDAQKDRPRDVVIAISADGRYEVNGQLLADRRVQSIALALRQAADKDSTVIISADAQTTQQALMNALEAARREGLMRITFSGQSGEE